MGELSARWAVFCTFALPSNIIHPNYYSSYEITNSKGGKTKCYITTELKTHCKSLCVRAFGRFAR